MADRVLLVSTTTGYQTRAFGDAAARLGIDLILATDRCDRLPDPWRDGAVPVRFYDEAASIETLVAALTGRDVRGVLAVGDRPARLAALAAEALGLPGHPPAAAAACRDKVATRQRLADAGLPVPWFVPAATSGDPGALAATLHYPCVVKPLGLSGSRGVIRANDPDEFVGAFGRILRLLCRPDLQAQRDPLSDTLLTEGYIRGREHAVEGWLDRGDWHTLAIFDKPAPLEGPFFEETIYVTPTRLDLARERQVRRTVARAAEVLGLYHGPVHAECRVTPEGEVFVLEVAARPIGGLCARALRFEGEAGPAVSLETLLLDGARGRAVGGFRREAAASGVMMIPIPRRGVYRRTECVSTAAAVPGITAVEMTAKPDHVIEPLPEGGTYLGFIFARASDPSDVERALRVAHAELRIVIDSEVPVL